MIAIMQIMRVDKPTQARHRAAMLEQGARLFRRDGIDAVGVADVTRAAGLTHGAFYGHFPSKSALAAEACRAALLEAADRWRARAARARAAGEDPLTVLVDRYLTESHRDAPDLGCALAALGSEAVRDPGLRAALDAGAWALACVLAEEIAAADAKRPDPMAPENVAKGIAMLAAMNGGLLLARAFADDPARSRTALAAAAALARSAAA